MPPPPPHALLVRRVSKRSYYECPLFGKASSGEQSGLATMMPNMIHYGVERAAIEKCISVKNVNSVRVIVR